MAEVLPAKLPPLPTDLSFADNWDVKPILSIPFRQNSLEEF
jgi:hypothetical protein